MTAKFIHHNGHLSTALRAGSDTRPKTSRVPWCAMLPFVVKYRTPSPEWENPGRSVRFHPEPEVVGRARLRETHTAPGGFLWLNTVSMVIRTGTATTRAKRHPENARWESAHPGNGRARRIPRKTIPSGPGP